PLPQKGGGAPGVRRARLEDLLSLAEADDALRPGGGLAGFLAQELLDDLEPADPLLPPGTRVGPYEISGLLGRGGVGQVYRARDCVLGRPVAIKALSGAFRSEEH